MADNIVKVEEVGQITVIVGEELNVTGENVNVAGVGVYKQKDGTVLQFKGVASDDAAVIVVDNAADNQIDLSLDQSKIIHDDLGLYVANQHIDHSSISITAGPGLSGGGDLTQSRTITLENSPVTIGTYGDAYNVAAITVDQKGRIVNVANIPLDFGTATWGSIVGTIGNQTDLQTALNGKSDTSHNHDIDSLTGVSITTPSSGQVLKYNGTNWINDTVDGSDSSTWGNIVGILSDQTDLNLALGGKSDTTHDHDLTYAPIVHNHDGDYAPLSHDHDLTYAPIVHNHDGDYASLTHNHDLTYAPIVHNHDGDYASLTHNHDLTYAPIVHNHDGSYYTEGEVDTLLSGKSDTTHDHDGDYAASAHTHDDRYYTESETDTLLSGKSSTTHDHDSDYAALAHTHDDRYYTESETDNLLGGKSDTSHNHALSALTGVSITTPSTGQVLKYNGSNWINDTDAVGDSLSLDNLTDVAVTTPSSDQVLKYNGTSWVNAAVPAAADLKKFTMQMVLANGANNTYEFQRSARFAFTINAAYYDTVAGTITANIKINSTSVTGLSALSLGTTPGNATATAANTVAIGNSVSVTFTSNSSATFVSLMLECTRS